MVFQLNKEDNLELRNDFELIIRTSAEARMRSQQGILDLVTEITEEDEAEEDAEETTEPDGVA